MDGVELGHRLQSREVNACDVLDASIHAIDQLNPTLNAVVIKNFENASTSIRDGLVTGPLAGVPFLVKDVNVFTSDMPTTFSSRFFADTLPKPDSALVARWRAAGLVLLGKSNTPEFAGDFVCEPTFRGPTLNPWNPALTTGGSSGGAAAAVASGMVPIAHATDLGGSIRIPAACCGVFGLKPTSGLNPQGPYYAEIAGGFNSDHVLTRSVRDSAATLDATAGPLTGTRYQITPKVDSFLRALSDPVPRLRIGVCYQTPDGGDVDVAQRDAVTAVVKALQAFGHHVETYAYPPEPVIGPWAETLWLMDVVHELENRIDEVEREPERNELEALTRFARTYVGKQSAMDLYRARQRAHATGARIMASMQHLDLLLTPALGCDPIPVGSLDSRTDAFDFDEWSQRGQQFAPFAYVCNVSGQPAASLPVPLDAATQPSAVQLAGHHRDDHVLLAVCAQLERHFEWSTYKPPVWAGDL